MKKVLTMTLAIVLVVGLLVACTGNTTTTTTKPSGTTTATTAGTTTTGTTSPTTLDKSGITIKVLANSNVQSFKDGEDENNNEIIRFMEELSGYKLEYQILPREGGEQKRALIMASGDLPDLMSLGRDSYLDYTEKNYLTDLSDAIANNAAIQATKCFEEEVYKMSLVDGKPFAVCTPSNGSPAPDSLVVLSEVAEALGIKIESPDMSLTGIMNMFAAAKAAFPAKTVYTGAGNTTNGYKLADFRWLYAAYDVDTTWRVKADGGLEYCAVTDDMYDCLAYIRDMYDKGYLDPEFATVNNPTLQERLANRSSSFYGVSWYDWPGTLDVYTSDKKDAFPLLGQAVGTGGRTGQDLQTVVLNYMVVPRGCTIVDHVVEYLVALTSDEAYEFLFYGEEGKQFNFDAAGKRIPLDDPQNYRKTIGVQFYVYYYIYEDMIQRTERLGFMAIDDPVRQRRHSIYGLDLKSKLNPAYNMPSITIYNERNPDINSSCAEWFLKIATGAVGLDDGWTAFKKEFTSLGGDDVVKAVSDWYVNQ